MFRNKKDQSGKKKGKDQRDSKPKATHYRKEMLFPKESGLTGANKPVALILHSPLIKADKACSYADIVKLAGERGQMDNCIC